MRATLLGEPDDAKTVSLGEDAVRRRIINKINSWVCHPYTISDLVDRSMRATLLGELDDAKTVTRDDDDVRRRVIIQINSWGYHRNTKFLTLSIDR
jgi:hypothetical protein